MKVRCLKPGQVGGKLVGNSYTGMVKINAHELYKFTKLDIGNSYRVKISNKILSVWFKWQLHVLYVHTYHCDGLIGYRQYCSCCCAVHTLHDNIHVNQTASCRNNTFKGGLLYDLHVCVYEQWLCKINLHTALCTEHEHMKQLTYFKVIGNSHGQRFHTLQYFSPVDVANQSWCHVLYNSTHWPQLHGDSCFES